VLTLIASLLLAVALTLPTWRIDLLAPQYPEGLGMQIRLGGIEGVGQYDLQNITELNHYIGMRVIQASDMPELRFMPSFVVALATLGLGVAAHGRRGPLVGWIATLMVAAAAGIGDFWWRTYSYGHALDVEHAVITIPGMAYQPPIIGTKQILNFTASAWPAAGGISILLACTLAAAALWIATHDARTIAGLGISAPLRPRRRRRARSGVKQIA
jgi:copper chaperone NosL